MLNNYRKIEKKKDNDIDANVAQLERSNNKYYAPVFRYILRQIMYHHQQANPKGFSWESSNSEGAQLN